MRGVGYELWFKEAGAIVGRARALAFGTPVRGQREGIYIGGVSPEEASVEVFKGGWRCGGRV